MPFTLCYGCSAILPYVSLRCHLRQRYFAADAAPMADARCSARAALPCYDSAAARRAMFKMARHAHGAQYSAMSAA